ncbi:DUF6456 domain-containing protein [Parablastomonas sp. CN1-191]|uniref:DUF6456 domain-containing protein n=1 Tax=Parablastomonas sp. CN1-191 TaxID=3400908 RepID=UPI003BF85FE6
MPRHLVERELTPAGPARRPAAPGRRSVTVNLGESPLTWLHARGHLDDRQLAAGELLRRDYEAAQVAAGITMRWDVVRSPGSGGGRGLNPGERQVAARRRFDAALGSAGPGLSDIIWRVVCAGESVPAAERALAWPTRSGKLVLRIALDRLAGYYRVP